MTNVPNIADIKAYGCLRKNRNDKLHNINAKRETKNKKNKGNGDELEDLFVFGRGKGWLEEVENVVNEEGNGNNYASGKAGINSKIKKLIWRREHHGDTIEVKKTKDKREDFLVVNKTKNSGDTDGND